eukprot:TRINITY_DN7127_c0_g1_i1.p1 TRINITY_DN7127_c0_g1~~TRINITY_DN7127_c0_g1_i1.p1  ORF type:complete len:367 (-),score=57.12 TRINITY_DN7127_c0_g1_i1:187-1287(-)
MCIRDRYQRRVRGSRGSAMAWRELQADNPPCPRSSHGLSSHGSRIYLFGGETGPLHSHFGYGLPVLPATVHTLDLLQPEAWSEVEVSEGAAPSPRLGHGQVIIETEAGVPFLYVFGGRQPAVPDQLAQINSLNDTHRLNLITGAWEELCCTGEVPSVRSYLSMVSVGTTLFLFGGMINDDRYSDLYSFDTNSCEWTRLPDGPMEGRGGAGLCVVGPPDDASLLVVAGHCGRPVGDVWQYHIGAEAWQPREQLAFTVPRSIFACAGPMSLQGRIDVCVFGGELEAATGDKTAGKYSNETLLLQLGSEGGGVRTLPVEGEIPAGRGWTSGTVVQLGEGRCCFAVFGGIREGVEGEPVGVRLGDLVILE